MSGTVYETNWSASEILEMVDKLGPAATKVLVLAIDKHDCGWRPAHHCSECEGELFSPFLCGKNEEIRKEAGIESVEEFDTILGSLESQGYFSVLRDPRGHDHILKFDSPTNEEVRKAHDEGIAKKESAAQRLRSREEYKVLMAEHHVKKLNIRAQNPFQYCSSLRINGEPCLQRPTGRDGVCTQHRKLMLQARCTEIKGSGNQRPSTKL